MARFATDQFSPETVVYVIAESGDVSVGPDNTARMCKVTL